MKDIPYLVHESQMARMERMIKRLFVLCVILIVLLFGTNAGWIWYENQFVDVETTVEQGAEADDYSNAIIYDGVHINDGEGVPESNDQTQSEKK